MNLVTIAKKFEINLNVLEAIVKVESAGSSTYTTEGPWKGELKVLFEGHYFFKFTKGKFAKSHPSLCYKTWTTKYYRKGQLEFSRFLEALKLDKTAAQLSTSWGSFQIMGSNFKSCGYESVTEMIEKFYTKGFEEETNAFLNYCKNRKSKKYNIDLIALLQYYSQTSDVKFLKEFVANYNGTGQIEKYTNLILKHV